MNEPMNRTPEEQLMLQLAEIVGEDPVKLASVRSKEIDPAEVLKAFPGMAKIASLATMEVRDILEDPNFTAGVNHELQMRAEEWVPAARTVLGL